MKQESLFDAGLARELREEGIWQADENALPEWRDVALLALKRCARHYERFIVDRVWDFIPRRFSTNELRAMGAVMRRGVRSGWIVATRDFVPSDRASAHRNPRRVWRSRIYMGRAA